MRKLHKLSTKFLYRIGSPMARIIPLLFIFCLLFSSCYTYKNMETAGYEIKPNKTYRITTETLIKKKIKVIEVTNSEIVGRIDMKNVVIPVSEIQEIKLRKFSYFKSFVVVPATYVAAGIGLVYSGVYY